MDQYKQTFPYNPVLTCNWLGTTPDRYIPAASWAQDHAGLQHAGCYDNILGDQIVSDMYASIPPQSHHGSISAPSSPSSSGLPSISYAHSRQERRRQQNRMSQRAFRERKAKEHATLEGELKQLADKHERLQESYSSQSGEVCRLKAEIQKLTKTIDALSKVMEGLDESTEDTRIDGIKQE